jgi:uracil-DNA glycosylase
MAQRTLDELRAEAAPCTACDLYRDATDLGAFSWL